MPTIYLSFLSDMQMYGPHHRTAVILLTKWWLSGRLVRIDERIDLRAVPQ